MQYMAASLHSQSKRNCIEFNRKMYFFLQEVIPVCCAGTLFFNHLESLTYTSMSLYYGPEMGWG